MPSSDPVVYERTSCVYPGKLVRSCELEFSVEVIYHND